MMLPVCSATLDHSVSLEMALGLGSGSPNYQPQGHAHLEWPEPCCLPPSKTAGTLEVPDFHQPKVGAQSFPPLLSKWHPAPALPSMVARNVSSGSQAALQSTCVCVLCREPRHQTQVQEAKDHAGVNFNTEVDLFWVKEEMPCFPSRP